MVKLANGKATEPLHNYVFVKINDEYDNPYINKKTESGLILPGANHHFSQETGEMEKSEVGIIWGVVVAVGALCTTLKIGDEVYFDKRGARVIPILDGGYRMISEQNIQSRIFDFDGSV